MAVPTLTRVEVLRARFSAHGLVARAAQRSARTSGADDADDWLPGTAVLDLGVQDTGPSGAAWSLAQRGVPVTPDGLPPGLALVWTLRGAPHVHRRDDLPALARAQVPWSEKDVRRRFVSASAPLVEAGVDAADALVTVARAMREVVTVPTAKGELSARLTAALPEAYSRWCPSCGATHVYELPFRLASLHAGLELVPGSSPPVLVPVPGWPDEHLDGLAEAVRAGRGLMNAGGDARAGGDGGDEAGSADTRLDPVRAYLRLLGPARPADVAAHVNAPAPDVRARWSRLEDELVEVEVDGERRWALGGPPAVPDPTGTVRLLDPFDPFLAAQDRELLVPDAAARKDLWRTLGRPGAVVRDGEVLGTWRPRTSGARLRLATSPWAPWGDAVERAVDDEAERLAALRGATYAGRAS